MASCDSNNSGGAGGIGVCGALGVLFVALKLMGYIDWSWWWVTAPFWGGFALFLLICVGLMIWAVVEHAQKRAKNR